MNKKPEHKRAFTVAEAAKYACVSRGIVELWIAKRLLPFEELPGQGNGRKRFRRIRRLDLDAFLDTHYKKRAKPQIDISLFRDQLDLFSHKLDAASEKS